MSKPAIKPLTGIKVLSVTGALFGPYCAMVLADLGADVIKVERPGAGDMNREWGPFFKGIDSVEKSAYFFGLHRNERGITLNLKSPKAKEMLKELVKKSDVIIENFKPGVMDEWGLGYADLKKVNPKIIYACGSGFGHYGPYSSWPSYDIIGQAMGGFMDMNGWPDKPPARAGSSIGDIVSGMFLAIGILAALRYREMTGKGQIVDIAQVDSMVAVSETAVLKYTVEGVIPTRGGSKHPTITPFDIYPTTDGYACIAAGNDAIFGRLCQAMGKPELAKDPRFDTNPHRTVNYDALKPFIVEWTKDKKKWEVTDLCHKVDCPSAPVYNIKEVIEDDHIARARAMIVSVEHPVLKKPIRICGSPIKMSECPMKEYTPAPMLGEHNFNVLNEMLGYTKAQVDALKKEGVI